MPFASPSSASAPRPCAAAIISPGGPITPAPRQILSGRLTCPRAMIGGAGTLPARRWIEHKAKHAGRRSKRRGKALVAVGQGGCKARQIAPSETGAELPGQRCRRVAVGVLEQDIDGDDRRTGFCDNFDKARNRFPRPRPQRDGVEAPRVDIDDDDAWQRRRTVPRNSGRAKHDVPCGLDGAVEHALAHGQECGNQHGGRHDAAERWRHRCQTDLNQLSFGRCVRGPRDRRTNGRMCGRSRRPPPGSRAQG